MSEEQVKPEVEKFILELELSNKKKHLNWFDYQKRGGRFKDKTPEELTTERETILEDIKLLEEKISGFEGEL